MSPENDYALSRLAVRLDNIENGTPIGSGILFNCNTPSGPIYLITAAHCLYEDEETFQLPRLRIQAQFFDPRLGSHQSVTINVNHDLVSKSPLNDIAIIHLEKDVVELITGELPTVHAISERHSITSFVLKGFPSATRGQEIVMTKPEFVQANPGRLGFQLRLTDDFTTDTSAESKVDGFSGSGIFLETHGRLYLYGIFTRFREAQKIIYCQNIETANELLAVAFLQTIPFTYIGEHGLTPEFFARHNSGAINNLGPRFSEQLNLRLPIVGDFHDARRGNAFKYRLQDCVEQWLDSHRHSGSDFKGGILETTVSEWHSIKKSVITWITNIQWRADQHLSIAPIQDILDSFKLHVDAKKEDFYALRQRNRQQETPPSNEKKNAHTSRRQQYEDELTWLRTVDQAIYALERALLEISITLANNPFLVIKGEPGCGKSHLLGDIASLATKDGVATLLLLGQLFTKSQSVAQNILSQLGLNCSPDELFNSLNSIGRQQGARVLLMIDALNEGPGKDLWKDSLAGFIQDVKRYPFVGVIMTVRSTYFNAILPTNLQNDETITYRDHQGFKGNEYAALRLFCEHYELQMPTFPILTPEFANPLFLQLLCQGVKISRNRTFPQGFQGITKVFNYYIDAVFERLVGKRDEYENRRHIVRDAIFTVAKACFSDDNSRILSFEDADRLFEKTFPRFQHLLNDLIHENVFIQTTQNTYDLNPGFEALSFSYERFGDIFIAEELLAGYVSTADVSQAFQKDGKLGRLLKGYLWPNRGVLDAMAIRLPERYGLELMEICDWVYAEEEDSEYSDVGEWLSRSFWESLKWRHPESIDNAKITTWLNSDQCMLNEHEYTLKLVELATVQQHPFNSDRLFRYLNQFSMAERDAFWQEHMLRYSRYDDDRNALPIRRLMDWAWQKGISSSVDMETARLAAQTLAWLLSSTYRQLRDQVTKAMVNLLEEQPDVLIEVMTAFKDTDDVYISERLYAVAYGCVLRTANGSSIAKIAKYVYNRTFIGKNPPIHVLLRDYARNILEYADYKGLADYADMARVRPPYNSDFPKRLPSESEIKQFENSFEGTGQSLEKEKNRIYGQIHFSTTTWDFGRYVVKSALRHFAPTSFKFESTYRDFKKSLKGKRKSFISVLESSARLHSVIEERRAQGVKSLFGKSTDDWLREEEEHLQVCLDRMNGPFDQIEMMQIRDEFLPFLKAKYASQSGQRDAIDDGPIKRWIVQRSFQLGYDIEKHYDYDSRTERLNEFPDYYGSKIERIGKKYQWIAFHEIVARLCDNYHFIEDRWSSSAKYGLYQGPWQLLIRDVDPVFTTKTKREENDSDLGEATDFSKKDWRFDADYRYWNQPVSQWVRNKQDLPAPEKMILRKDDYGHEWVYLRMNKTWKEPKGVGSDRHISRKEIWYGINSYLVPKRDRKKIVAWLEGKNFFGRWMPEPDEMSLNLFNRENYWSPAAKFDNSQRNLWETISGTKFKVILTTNRAVGEMSEDKSDAHFYYEMPSKIIFEGMGLNYASEDGCFTNGDGQVVVINVDQTGVLVRRKELVLFLNNNNYDILWTLLGEKNALTGLSTNSDAYFKAICGVYQFEGDKIIGDLSIFERN